MLALGQLKYPKEELARRKGIVLEAATEGSSGTEVGVATEEENA